MQHRRLLQYLQYMPIRLQYMPIRLASQLGNNNIVQKTNRHIGVTCRSPLMYSKRHISLYKPYQHSQQQDDKVLVRVFEQGKTLPHQQWVMRMNNQNGYLSWCRNSYICLSISVAISMSEKYINQSSLESLSNISYESAVVGLVGLSCFNIAFGSAEFLYQLIKTKHLTQISWLTLGIYVTFAVLHTLLFLKVAARMLPEDDDDDEPKEL